MPNFSRATHENVNIKRLKNQKKKKLYLRPKKNVQAKFETKSNFEARPKPV
jgi:hypothetical protein